VGRRSRQRTAAPLPPSPPPAAAPAPARRRRRDEAPKPPWGDLPVVELCALAAIALGIWGLLRGRDGAVQLTVAAMLGSVAGLEVAIREHLAGFRSHTLVLAGACTVGIVTLLFVAGLQRTLLVPIAAVVLLVAIGLLRTLFKRRSGGFGFRVR